MEYTKDIKHKCSKRVYGQGRMDSFHSHNCTKPATVERDGKWYCKVHDPEYITWKNEQATIKWKQENKTHLTEIVAGIACSQINHENPIAVAESIKDMYEALQDAYNEIDYLQDKFKVTGSGNATHYNS